MQTMSMFTQKPCVGRPRSLSASQRAKACSLQASNSGFCAGNASALDSFPVTFSSRSDRKTVRVSAAAKQFPRAMPSAPLQTTVEEICVAPLSISEDIQASLTPKSDRVNPFPKKTHIVCTLGPSSRTVEQLSALLEAGMDVARFNFSHGTHEYHQETLDNLREAIKNTGKICAVLLDTKGPEIRTGFLKDECGGKITIKKNSEITLTTDYDMKGDATSLAFSYKRMAEVVKPGNEILVADGALVLRVLSTDPKAGTVRALATNTASIGERKNCNLPGVKVDLPILTAKDEDDLVNWGVKNSVDFIAASFVRNGSDVRKVRKVLDDADGHQIHIISKVENQEGLQNLQEIVDLSDGLMVARGDLGMEIPLEKMFYVQKLMIHLCNIAGKPVITATQMLDSMISHPRPTRAECTDVANAVLDGTDCVMLSGETAAGDYPRQAVEIMSNICEEAERCIDNYQMTQELLKKMLVGGSVLSTIESLAANAVLTSMQINASLIVCLAANGYAARLIAKYRPSVPVVVGVIPKERRSKIGFLDQKTSADRVMNQLQLCRGLIPILCNEKDDALEPAAAAKKAVLEALEEAKARGLCEPGDQVVSMYNVERACAVIRVLTVD